MKTFQECKEEARYYAGLVDKLEKKLKDAQLAKESTIGYRRKLRLDEDIVRCEVALKHHTLTTELWLKRAKKVLDKKVEKCDSKT